MLDEIRRIRIHRPANPGKQEGTYQQLDDHFTHGHRFCNIEAGFSITIPDLAMSLSSQHQPQREMETPYYWRYKMQLKTLLIILILGVSALFVGLAATGQLAQTGSSAASADSLAITVYRSPTCGCCKAWIDHLKTNGFHVEDNVTADVGAKKAELGLPTQLASCHTAVINGYVIEGHVPANDIKQLLTQKPAITGLAVPGMPAGSPGMETGGQQDPFDVIAFDKAGTMSRFNHYPAR